MKICPNCNCQLDDNAGFCNLCGYNFAVNNQQFQNQQYYGAPPQYTAPPCFDHTAEFSAKDISDNKVIAMLTYLLGTVGILIALLSSSNSDYVAFHVRQSLKILVCQVICIMAAAILFWTLIIPFAAGIASIVLTVVKVISFVEICQGKAKEPAIIKNFKFLK